MIPPRPRVHGGPSAPTNPTCSRPSSADRLGAVERSHHLVTCITSRTEWFALWKDDPMTLNVALLLLILLGGLSSVAVMQVALHQPTDRSGHRHGRI